MNETKTRIAKEALDIIAFEGIDKLTISTLAKHMDLAKASLYHYFTTKDEILDYIYEEGHRNLMANGFRIKLDMDERMLLVEVARHWKMIFTSELNMPFIRMLSSLRFTDERAMEEYNALLLMIKGQSDVILKDHSPFISTLFSSLLTSRLENLLYGDDVDVEKSAEEFSALL